MEESGGWTAYKIIIAIATTGGALAALGGVALRFLKWLDKRETATYRFAARAAIRNLAFARVEVHDLLTRLQPQDEFTKALVQRLAFHLDKALDDAEDAIPTDALEASKVRPQHRITINEVVDDGGQKP